MFYRLITQKRDEWLCSADCTIRELLSYIDRKGRMRDAQLDAIKNLPVSQDSMQKPTFVETVR